MTQIVSLVEAFDSFISGCKADGTWDSLRASCVIAGWSNLSGALTPLRPAFDKGPTSVNFVNADYNSEFGLLGNGVDKYLNTNRDNTTDLRNNKHLSVYLTSGMSATSIEVALGSRGLAGILPSGTSLLYTNADNNMYYEVNTTSLTDTPVISGVGSLPGFIGATRSGSASFIARGNGTEILASQSSLAPVSGAYAVFARTPESPDRYSTCRLTFYSIGLSVDLGLLDRRTTILMSGIQNAIT